MAAVGPDRAKIRDYFETKVKNAVGPEGSISWSAGLHGHEGPGVDGFVGVKVVDGKFTLSIPDLPQYANTNKQ